MGASLGSLVVQAFRLRGAAETAAPQTTWTTSGLTLNGGTDTLSDSLRARQRAVRGFGVWFTQFGVLRGRRAVTCGRNVVLPWPPGTLTTGE